MIWQWLDAAEGHSQGRKKRGNKKEKKKKRKKKEKNKGKKKRRNKEEEEKKYFCCWACVMHCVRLLQSLKTTRHHNSRGILPNYSPRQTPSAHQKHKLRQPELVESSLHPSVGSCRNICPATPSAGRYTAAMVQCYMQVLADLAKIHTHCA